MDTKKTNELLKHFKDHGISHDPKNGLQYVLDYQDIIGRANMHDIADFESTLQKGQEKQHFVWVNFQTLSQDMALDILKSTVVRRFVDREAEAMNVLFDRKTRELDKKQSVLAECKKAIYKRIRKLETEKNNLAFRLDLAKKNLADCRDRNLKLIKVANDNKSKAEKYDNIKELLN